MPKENQDEPQDMDADSSAATELDEAVSTTGTEPETEAAAESSTATDEAEVDTLSVVRDVVGERKEEPAEAASSAEGEEGTEGVDEPTTEQDDDDYSNVPFSKHPRFQQLLRKAKSSEADAKRYQNVEKFLRVNNLTSEEAADTMEIAGLAKTDPIKAWERIKPWVQQLLVAAGEVLPEDLRARVEKKELTEAVAKELSVARAKQLVESNRVKFQSESQQREQNDTLARTLMDTVEQWVVNRRIKDPNFAKKEARLSERIAFLQRTEGKPNTVDGVKAQLKKAYEQINKDPAFAAQPAPRAAARPAVKPAIRPVGGGQVAADAREAKPANTLEVIQQVRRQRAQA